MASPSTLDVVRGGGIGVAVGEAVCEQARTRAQVGIVGGLSRSEQPVGSSNRLILARPADRQSEDQGLPGDRGRDSGSRGDESAAPLGAPLGISHRWYPPRERGVHRVTEPSSYRPLSMAVSRRLAVATKIVDPSGRHSTARPSRKAAPAARCSTARAGSMSSSAQAIGFVLCHHSSRGRSREWRWLRRCRGRRGRRPIGMRCADSVLLR